MENIARDGSRLPGRRPRMVGTRVRELSNLVLAESLAASNQPNRIETAEKARKIIGEVRGDLKGMKKMLEEKASETSYVKEGAAAFFGLGVFAVGNLVVRTFALSNPSMAGLGIILEIGGALPFIAGVASGAFKFIKDGEMLGFEKRVKKVLNGAENFFAKLVAQ